MITPRDLNTQRHLQKENASFLLGMDLFGSTEEIQQRFIETLDKVERDLTKIQQETAATAGMNNLNDDSFGLDSEDNDDFDDESPESIAEQIQSYQYKIQFLKQLSKARALLDESTSLASNHHPEPDYVQASQLLIEATNAIQIIDEDVAEASSRQQQKKKNRLHNP